ARLDGQRARPRPMVVPQTLHFQAGLYRRLGRICHRPGQFRRHFLSLRQALRTNARLAAAAKPAGQARPDYIVLGERVRATMSLVEWPGTMSTKIISPPAASTISRPTTCSRV